mgnify:CR=1 FL=1
MSEAEEIRDILARETGCVGFVGIRGSGKGMADTFLLENLTERYGWHPLILDVKGEDETLHVPAQGIQAELLRAEGLSPRGFNTAYFTFNYPLAMFPPPLHFELASISVRMLSIDHFRLLGSFLTPTEQRELFDAYYTAGGHGATMEDIMKALMARKGEKVSPRLLAFLTSGFLADESPLEPATLLRIMERHDFTVLSTAYFPPSARELSRFALYVVMDNLMSHLLSSVEETQLIIVVRELREVAPKSGAMGALWHLARQIETFVTLLRQTRFATSRLFYEVQNFRSVPDTIRENTRVLFVHPENLRDPSQLKEISKHFPIPERVKRAIPGMKFKPGRFILLTRDGQYAIVTFPPPRSFRIFEDPRHKKSQMKIYTKLVTWRDLREDLNRARAEYLRWMTLAKVGRIDLDVGVVLRPDMLDPSKLPKYVATALTAVAVFLARNSGLIRPKITVRRKTLASTMVELFRERADGPLWSEKGGRGPLTTYEKSLILFSPSHVAKLVRRHPEALTMAGIFVASSEDGRDFVFEVDVRKFVTFWSVAGEEVWKRAEMPGEPVTLSPAMTKEVSAP